MKVTLKYGAGNSLETTFPEGATVDQATSLARPALRLPANAQPTIYGAPVCGTCPLVDGMTIVYADKAQPKES